MSVLSDIDIVKELGKNILIFPFEEDNLKGASYNLTVSKYAWNLTTKISAYDETKNSIIIPANSTVVIETREAIWVSKGISGTYHSKVKLVSKGIGHISTTLDPTYIGCSLIALHNLTYTDVSLKVDSETFVTIRFEYLSASCSSKHHNQPGRLDVLSDLSIQISDSDKLHLDSSYMVDEDKLRSKLCETQAYKAVKSKYSQGHSFFIRNNLVYFIALSFFVITFGLNLNQESLRGKGWYFGAQSSFSTLFVIFTTLAGKQMIDDLKGKN